MDVFAPVSAVAAPNATQPIAEEAFSAASVMNFLQDHFVKGGYRGGKIAYDLMHTVQNSADETKKELVRNLPTILNHLREVPGALNALMSAQDPVVMSAIERELGALARDVACATGCGVMLGISRLVDSVLPLTVAAGAVLGTAVGGGRLDALVQYARETIKQD